MNQRSASTGPRVHRPQIARIHRASFAGGRLRKIGSEFYIRASALASRRATRALADGESFAMFDESGDIVDSPLEALGFFYRDTRYLSRFELKIGAEIPHLLNSRLVRAGTQLRVTLTNPDIQARGEAVALPRNSLEVERDWVLANHCLLHRLLIRNYARRELELEIDLVFGGDFADVFQVRGVSRQRHGKMLEPQLTSRRVRLRYLGFDGIERSTEISFSIAPQHLGRGYASYSFNLKPEEPVILEIRVAAQEDEPSHKGPELLPETFDDAAALRIGQSQSFTAQCAQITTSNAATNSLLKASLHHLGMITSCTARGSFMMAGIPWFATLFGRDSIITALSLLPFSPSLAAGTLRTLAALQGSELDDGRDEQPGKILHELRNGEMARCAEVPFGRYYGSVDSTPLFLWLYGRYVAASGDLVLAEELWPNVERAVRWVERWGDLDGDGYIEYLRKTARGLSNQGWKDSFDAISHGDGTLARPPIAMAEVQGYWYAACLAIAEIASKIGRAQVAEQLLWRAQALRAAFVRDFWLEPQGTVALALDADKRPCRVMASNAGHCLATGLLDAERGAALAERLLGDDMFSGWGLRTLGAAERRYNPMAYHNGSIWPHDTAVAVFGLARTGHRAAALKILSGLREAALELRSGSLPELFCGFAREPDLAPVRYPVACHPQAWSAASLFLMLQGILGLDVRGLEGRLLIRGAMLPEWLEWLKIERLAVGDGCVSLLFRRSPTTMGAVVQVLAKSDGIEVETVG